MNFYRTLMYMRRKSDKPNNFHFIANRKLNKQLGEYNALVQFQELAVLDLLKDAKQSGKSIDIYVTDLSKDYGIPLRNLPFDDYQNQLHLSYLVYPYSCCDSFLDKFRKEVKCFLPAGFDWESERGQSILEKTVCSFKKNGIDLNIPEHYINVFNYYRIARNILSHNGTERELQKYYDKINREEILKMLPGWPNALKEFNVFELDDMVAFSTIVKRIADHIPHELFSHIDWSILSAYSEEWRSFMKKLHAKFDKIQTLRGYIKQTYGVVLSDDQLNQAYENLLRTYEGA